MIKNYLTEHNMLRYIIYCNKTIPPTIHQVSAVQCDCASMTPKLADHLRSEYKYEWRSNVCEVEQFDADLFCQLIENKERIVFLGDSLLRQTHETFKGIRCPHPD